jgi:hypothetical protein
MCTLYCVHTLLTGEQEDEDYGVEEGEGKADEIVSDFTMVRRFFKNLVKQWEEVSAMCCIIVYYPLSSYADFQTVLLQCSVTVLHNSVCKMRITAMCYTVSTALHCVW